MSWSTPFCSINVQCDLTCKAHLNFIGVFHLNLTLWKAKRTVVYKPLFIHFVVSWNEMEWVCENEWYVITIFKGRSDPTKGAGKPQSWGQGYTPSSKTAKIPWKPGSLKTIHLQTHKHSKTRSKRVFEPVKGQLSFCHLKTCFLKFWQRTNIPRQKKKTFWKFHLHPTCNKKKTTFQQTHSLFLSQSLNSKHRSHALTSKLSTWSCSEDKHDACVLHISF